MFELPIHVVLPRLLAALQGMPSAVLVAPPGAGKTTAVAPALLQEDWCTGTVILLSPRRLAARAAAERMAETLGEKPGETVGYLTRLDSKRSQRTRILVMTEAIFVSTILEDPEMQGISAVLFDEAHERHLDSDLGLALAIESQQVLRPDLKLLVMSATLDGARFASLLRDAPVIESEGRAYPLSIRWFGASPEKRTEDAMASAVMAAWREEAGDILAFLPGVGEIERTRERLEEKLPGANVMPLHGQCDPAAQRAAIRRDPEGRRRIVLATSIAETSLTLDGVTVAVDSGLARRAEFDKSAGVSRLVTRKASRASADQRAGRAARQAPGVAYRLWEEAAQTGRPAFDPPEIETSDLTSLVLTLAKWGARDPSALAWLDPPPAASVQAAQLRLRAMGAIDEAGAITRFGEQVSALAMEPDHAAMLLLAAQNGEADEAARLVLLLQERGLGGRSEDLAVRLDRWRSDRSPRAQASRKLAQRWAAKAGKLVKQVHGNDTNSAMHFASARPDMVARARDGSGEHWQSAGGRGYFLDPASPLGRAEWVVIGDAQGQAKGARITAAIEIAREDVEAALAEHIDSRALLRWNDSERRVEARLERRLGAIKLASGPDARPDEDAIMALLLEKAREALSDLLPETLLARARYAGIDTLSPATLADDVEAWLAPLLAGRRDLGFKSGDVTNALMNRLEWDTRQRLDRLAPREFTSPAGSHHQIDYADEGGPSVEVRAQALFGLDRHPTIGEPAQPLLLKLTSPAGRPLQSTQDLPGFWRGSWRDVVRDMKGRYPKHRWPDEPWREEPSTKTKNAFENSKRT